jgi:hypothetical protein
LKLRWLDLDALAEPTWRLLETDAVSAVTVLVTASELLTSRWDDLSDEDRVEIATTINRRAHQLRVMLRTSGGRL